MCGTPQTIVSNFVNTSRQHMLQKTADELLGDDGHGFGLIVLGILIPKGHLTVVDRDDSAVGDGYTVNVAGQIFEDCVGALDDRFRMSDPFFLPYVSR